MDEENVIRPEHIATTIRSDDLPSRVGVTYYDDGKRHHQEIDAQLELVIPDKKNETQRDYYIDTELANYIFGRISTAIKESVPHLRLLDGAELTETERIAYQQLLHLSSGDEIDLATVDFNGLTELLHRLKRELEQSPNEQGETFVKAVKRIFRQSSNLSYGSAYEDMVFATFRTKDRDDGSPAFTEISHRDRVVNHEVTHLVDMQAHEGVLIDCYKRYLTLCDEKEEMPDQLETVRQLKTIIDDVLEARAYISEVSGSRIREHPNLDDTYSHTALCVRLLDTLKQSFQQRYYWFTSWFVHNDPKFEEVGNIHEEHAGGTLLLAFIDAEAPKKILEDLSYEHIIDTEDTEDDEPYRTAVIKRFQELVNDPEAAKRRLEASWAPLGSLLTSLVERFDVELSKVEGVPNDTPPNEVPNSDETVLV